MLVIFLGIFQMATIATHGLTAMARYMLTLGTLCAMFAGFGLSKLTTSLNPTRCGSYDSDRGDVPQFGAYCGAQPGSQSVGDRLRQISPLMQFSVHLEEVAKSLHQRMQPGDRLVIDNFNDGSNLVAAAIGLPLLVGDRAFMPSSENSSDPRPFISSYHPRFAIVSERGIIGPRPGFPPACLPSWIVDGMDFRCLYENEIYWVYEIGYSQAIEQ